MRIRNGFRRAVGVLLLAGIAASAQAADGVVGPGNCNEAGFSSVLTTVDGSGGGTITFNCGTATITFTNYKQISHAVVIDGGGTITFDGGNASPFFQVYASANVTLRRLVLQRGQFAGSHALENFGQLRLDQVTVRNNVSAGSAVASSGTLTVVASTFSGNTNSAAAPNGDGGAILNNGGTLQVSASTFTGNSANGNGGAIFSNSSMRIVNSTFTGNSTTGTGSGGGAIYQTGTGSSEIIHATIANNSGATYGGGVYSAIAELTISRSIIADNANGNCDGVSTSGGYNVWSGTTQCPFAQPGDGAGNPVLGALANNGGPTQTRLPGAGSVAINRIPVAQCPIRVDQRGGGRPSGAGCDSGAVEVGATLDVIFQDGFDF